MAAIVAGLLASVCIRPGARKPGWRDHLAGRRSQLAAQAPQFWRIRGRCGSTAICGRNTIGGRPRVSSYNTINEFPAFSFMLADLHAHVLALPFATLAILSRSICCWPKVTGLPHLARHAGAPDARCHRLCLGRLSAINGWDLPTYLGLVLLALMSSNGWLTAARFSRLLAGFFIVGGFLGGLTVRSTCRSIVDSPRPRRALASCRAMSARPSATSSRSMGCSPSFSSRMVCSLARERWRMCWRSARRHQTMSHYLIAD